VLFTGLTATETTELSNISLRSIAPILINFCTKIADWCQQDNLFKGTMKLTKRILILRVFHKNEAG